MKEAIQVCAPLLLSENDKKPVPLKMKLRNVPGNLAVVRLSLYHSSHYHYSGQFKPEQFSISSTITSEFLTVYHLLHCVI